MARISRTPVPRVSGVGVVRRTTPPHYERIEHLVDRIELVAADLLDQHSLTWYAGNPARRGLQSRGAVLVPTSWTQPVLTGEFTALGVTRILESVKLVHPTARFYQASSTEMFGRVTETPQRESTPFYPRTVRRRQGVRSLDHGELPGAYDLYAVIGILFNHESPRRGLEFVTRKVTTRWRGSSWAARGAPAGEPRCPA